MKHLKLFEIFAKTFIKQDEYLGAKNSSEYLHLINMGFIDITNERQLKNGTFAFMSPIEKKYFVYDDYLIRAMSQIDKKPTGVEHGFIYRIGRENMPTSYENAFDKIAITYLKYIKKLYKRVLKELLQENDNDILKRMTPLNYDMFKKSQYELVEYIKNKLGSNPEYYINVVVLSLKVGHFQDPEIVEVISDLLRNYIEDDPTFFTKYKELLDQIAERFKNILPTWLKRGKNTGLWNLER